MKQIQYTLIFNDSNSVVSLDELNTIIQSNDPGLWNRMYDTLIYYRSESTVSNKTITNSYVMTDSAFNYIQGNYENLAETLNDMLNNDDISFNINIDDVS